MKILLGALFFLIVQGACAQGKPFRFAFISDTHIGSPGGGAEEDLRRTVADINSMQDIAFVVLTGDITELGKREELEMAKHLLDSLRIRYYIIPGNHDTGWSGSGGLDFSKVFGDDKFHFLHNGIHFIGCASGPYVRMSDGHVPRNHINWLTKELKNIKEGEPIVFLNHYPLDHGLDNWYEVVDLLKTKNTVLALCGHGHNNRAVEAEDIPAVMGRSNLRAKAAEGGYNLVQVSADSFHFTERTPLTRREKLWKGVPFRERQYKASKTYPRPYFTINMSYPQVRQVWAFHSDANVVSTPAVFGKVVVFGNGNGEVLALSLEKGKRAWSFKTAGPIFSSPAANSTAVVLGSSDGSVYAAGTGGKLLWKRPSTAAVLGSPLLADDRVYIGGSDSCFRALNATPGAPVW
jgi:predicted phosphodiesterase